MKSCAHCEDAVRHCMLESMHTSSRFMWSVECETFLFLIIIGPLVVVQRGSVQLTKIVCAREQRTKKSPIQKPTLES